MLRDVGYRRDAGPQAWAPLPGGTFRIWGPDGRGKVWVPGGADSDVGGTAGVGAPGVATGFVAAGPEEVLPLLAEGRGAGFAAEGLGAAGLAAGVSGLGANASRTLRTTGASRVDEALDTYSPISVSFFKSSLLVIPISFAISWTRGLATTLLRKGHERTRAPLAH